MNIAVIDDERPAIDLLTAYIQRTEGLLLEHTFTDPMDALALYNHPSPPELTFLDIDMPGLTGIEFARIAGHKTKIILTTSFRDYGPEAFELLVCDYLLKPFSYERFLTAMEKASSGQALPLPAPGFFYIRTETRGKYLRMDVADIISIESCDNAVIISDRSGTVTGLHSLADLQAWLPSHQFFRVHRSYIINMNEIQSVDHGQVQMTRGAAIPIGRQYRGAFMDILNRLLIGGR